MRFILEKIRESMDLGFLFLVEGGGEVLDWNRMGVRGKFVYRMGDL